MVKILKGNTARRLFLDHPERFRGAGSMSGILALHHSGGSKQIIPAILGVEDIEDPVVAAQSAVNRLGRVREICADAPKLIVVSCGLQDKFLPATEEFAAALKASGLSYVELYSPEAHTWTYWTWVLPLHLKFFGEAM
jgi:S-formylglutathione hydrolase FrmB